MSWHALLERDVLAGLRVPTQENGEEVGERIATYAGKRNVVQPGSPALRLGRPRAGQEFTRQHRLTVAEVEDYSFSASHVLGNGTKWCGQLPTMRVQNLMQ
jgi:hypothetical protein